MAANRVIGRQGRLPWHLPEDLQAFKETTLGYPLIMGRRTFDSIGRALPGRRNIVITRNPHSLTQGAEKAASFDAAIELAAQDADRIFVIGGAEIFSLALERCEGIILTVLEREVRGDTLFPKFSDTDFDLRMTRRGNNSAEPYRIETYQRRQPGSSTA